jgi:hypothetical protein
VTTAVGARRVVPWHRLIWMAKVIEPGRSAHFGVIDVQPGPAQPDRVAGAIASKIIFVMLAVSAQALWLTFIAKLVLLAVF